MKGKIPDCVALKHRIQAQIDKEDEGLSPEEIRARRKKELETSDDPVAKKWRSLPLAKTY